MRRKGKLKTALAAIALTVLVCAGCTQQKQTSPEPAKDETKEAEAETLEETEATETTEEESFEFTKPIQLIVAGNPGATSDLSARLFAKSLSKHIGQDVIIVNIAGGGGSPAAHQVDDAEADGYTLLYIEENTLTNAAIGACDMTWSDFDLVSVFGGCGTTCFLASPVTGINSVEDMKNYYEENGPISMAITYGNPSHFMAAAIERASGIELRNVDVDTGTDKILAVVSGQLQLSQMAADQFEQYVESGDLNLIGNCGGERNQFIPDVPTFNEQGCEIGDFYKFWGVAYKKGTDEAIIKALDRKIEETMKDEEVMKEYENMMYDITYMSTEDAREYVKGKEDFYNDIAEYILSQGEQQ